MTAADIILAAACFIAAFLGVRLAELTAFSMPRVPSRPIDPPQKTLAEWHAREMDDVRRLHPELCERLAAVHEMERAHMASMM